MTDLRDYMDNDILHTVKAFLDDTFKSRGSFISKYQLRIKVVSEVTSEVESNPDKYKTWVSVIALASEKVLLYSNSVNGVGIHAMVDTMKTRLGVLDKQKMQKKDVGEFEA